MVGVLIYVTKLKNMKLKPKIIAATILGTALIGGITTATIIADLATTPLLPPTPPQQNPNWLMEPTANLDYSLYQVMALIDNSDPTIGEMGIYQQLILQRALEFSATASQAVRDSGHTCFQKPLACPYNLIEKGLKGDWEKATSAESKAAVIFRYRALLQARHGALLPPKESSALFPRIIERLAQDRELAERLTLNGIATQEKTDEK